MMKAYKLTCPDDDCSHQFEHQADPAVLDAGEFPLIVCPECEEEWEAEYYPATDALELLPDEDEEGDDSEEEDAIFNDDEEEEE